MSPSTTRDTAVKWTAYALACLLLLFGHELTLAHLRVWGIAPFLPPLLPAVLASMEDRLEGFVFALAFGVLCDLALTAPLPCLYTIAFPLTALLAALYRNGAAVVKAVKVSAATPTGYEAAFAALEQEAVDVIVCDSTSVDVQLKLRASVEKASGAQRERIGVVSGGASETAAKLVERAGKLNSERMVLTAPGDVRMAAAAAAVIAGESDPSVPVNGAVLAGFSGLSASYDDTQVDTLVTGGVTPLECVSGEVSIVRGITTRTTTGGAADKTWRELTTVRIVDDVIPALRASLRARFVRSKNTAQVRAAIRSQVMVELENKRAQEIIDSFGEVSVKASEDDPTVCLVEFSFAVAHGLNRIYLSAHITV